MFIIRPRTRLPVEAGHGFQIVVHDIRWTLLKDIQRPLKPTPEIRDQHLDAGIGRLGAYFLNTFGKMLCPTVTQIIPVDGSDNGIAEIHPANGPCQISRLLLVQGIRTTMGDITKWATAGAFVPHDHEGRRPLAKTFTNIGTTRLLTDRKEVGIAQNLLDLSELGVGRSGLDPNPVMLFQRLGGAFDLDWDA